MVSEQKEFLDAGITDYVGKPIDPDHLVATLAKWVRPTRSMESIPARQTMHKFRIRTVPDLPGVNVAESVRRIGGNTPLYCSLLDKFRVKERNIAATIRETLAAGDQKTAERLAHTLRGIAGTLGAKSLQELSASLESCIHKAKLGEVDSLLARMDQELATFISGIDQALEKRQP